MRTRSIRVIRVRMEPNKAVYKSLRLRVFALSLFLLVLASCAGPASVPVTPTSSPASTVPSHAPEIRFALVGQPSNVNVWSLFDESGASYANYALRSDEYPRLYRLSIPAREFEPYTAEGMPSLVTQEGGFYVATVKLQPGLKWSDASPLNAKDAAFTINTTLAFQLTFDWRSAYNPALLEHAEAVDDLTLKFFFKGPINVGDWQYGALQGPIVNQAYWSPRVDAAVALLPSQELIASLEEIKAEAATFQARIDADNTQLLTSLPDTTTYDELSARVTRNQNELNSLNFQLVKLQDEYDAALSAARAALFALSDDAEPTFGPFLRAIQSGETFTRQVNLLYPFEHPNFDHALYQVIPDETRAITALQNDQVDVILNFEGVSQQAIPLLVNDFYFLNYPRRSFRYLVLNNANPLLSDPALHTALFCLLNPGDKSFGSSWFIENSPGPCDANHPPERQEKAIGILKAAGYRWEIEPLPGASGAGFKMPDGAPFPSVTLLAPRSDIERVEQAEYIRSELQRFGIPLTVTLADMPDINYSVYSSGMYDMAILTYRVSEYPGFLCEWFQAPSPFHYTSSRFQSDCEIFNTTADLETARQAAQNIRSILMEDLPIVPLGQQRGYDAYRNVSYPFGIVLDGLWGLYGAPALAIPVQ